MKKTLEIKLTSSQASQLDEALAKSGQELRQIFRRMKKDQAEIDKLKVETQKIIKSLKSQLKAA